MLPLICRSFWLWFMLFDITAAWRMKWLEKSEIGLIGFVAHCFGSWKDISSNFLELLYLLRVLTSTC